MATKKAKVQIKHRFRDTVLYETEASSLSDAVASAVANRADLSYADLPYVVLPYGASLVGARLDGARLVGARLVGARLDGARLDGASLVGARLDGARLDGASLVGARLDGASLVGARLVGARLDGASLVGARLDGASLKDAYLPAPTMILLAYWGALSDQLCADLMVFDASNHPDPTAFERWAHGGNCPYNNVHVQRAANFLERKELWGKGEPCRPYDLMTRVLEEKCPEWLADKVAKFETKFKK